MSEKQQHMFEQEVTLKIKFPDGEGDPAEWDWATLLDVAPGDVEVVYFSTVKLANGSDLVILGERDVS